MNEQLKLYVWDGVLVDYTAGVMFALARDVDEARRLILAQQQAPAGAPERSGCWDDLQREPEVYDQPFGLAVWGGA